MILIKVKLLGFESLNKNFVDLAQGTTKYEIQIASNFRLYKQLSSCFYNDSIENNNAKAYIADLIFNETEARLILSASFMFCKFSFICYYDHILLIF
jgi:hypothetical protein